MIICTIRILLIAWVMSHATSALKSDRRIVPTDSSAPILTRRRAPSGPPSAIPPPTSALAHQDPSSGSSPGSGSAVNRSADPRLFDPLEFHISPDGHISPFGHLTPSVDHFGCDSNGLCLLLQAKEAARESFLEHVPAVPLSADVGRVVAPLCDT